MGPLDGLRVIELAGVGPGPFCAMLLSDLGAEVITVHSPVGAEVQNTEPLDRIKNETLGRGRRSIVLNLKDALGREVLLSLVAQVDVLIEGYRPGVMERLGLGPDVCQLKNPKLVYGRMTGWGQDGPLSRSPGHDLNFLAMSGALAHIGNRDLPPVAPMNLVGDFGGGGMLLALGVLAAVLHARTSCQGQVIDASMVDGSALLMTMMYELSGKGLWNEARESNFNDGGAHFNAVYETADGKYVSIAAMETKFYAELLEKLQLDSADLPEQWDVASWDSAKKRLSEVFREKTRDEWCKLLEGTDTCFAPVLTMSEAIRHKHHVERGTFIVVDGTVQPAPAPRFSHTQLDAPLPSSSPGEHTDEVLAELGLTSSEIWTLRQAGAVR